MFVGRFSGDHHWPVLGDRRGNTWRLVKNLWPCVKQISERVISIDGMLVLDFWHPANRYPDVMGYYTASALLHRALFPC